MKKTLVAGLIAAGVMVAGVAVAAPDYSGFQGKGAGWYAGADVGYAMANWKDSEVGSGLTVKNKNGVTYGLVGGYMFNSNLGLEAAYDFFQDTKFENSAGNTVAKAKNQNYFSLSSVFNVPINQQWNAFLKVGGAYLTPKVDFDAAYSNTGDVKAKIWAAQFAVGAGYMITPNVQLTAQLKHIMENKATSSSGQSGQVTPDYNAFTVGAIYKF